MVVIVSRTMVRPWRMVALLVLLTTDRRSFGTAAAEAPPATDGDVAANFTDIVAPAVRCHYKGRRYEPGSSVTTDQPCLKCTCVAGSLVCQLQVCPEMPDPPSQGCVVVHKTNKCCAHLQCYYDRSGVVQPKPFPSPSGPARMANNAAAAESTALDGGPSKGCVINGTIYAEGSAMDSSSLCEYCYCVKGRQQCVRPRCSLTVPGCTAVYEKHTCCPVRYKCSPLQNNASLTNNATDASTTTETSLSARLKDCRINGRLISLGEPVIGVARSSCETCFCINGQVRCDKVICPPIRAQISPNCGPVYTEGHCCPTSYNCSTTESRVSSTATVSATSTTTIIATVADDGPPAGSPSSPPTTVTSGTPAAPDGQSASVVDPKKTTTDPMESRHANPVGLTPDDFAGPKVTEKSNKFEMDYDEPTLPPSLPNLKIIPFVAADAVFDEPAAAYDNTYQPVVERVYNVSDVEEPPTLVVNSFSPPVETEGGFVPKDSPAPDGAIYVPDKSPTSTADAPTKPIDDRPDEPAVGHKPVWCVSNGKKYKHGELLTDPSACSICVCFNARIVCQENCPAVKVGCQRIGDPYNIACCGRIVCDENDDGTAERVRLTTTAPAVGTTKHGDAVVEHIVHSARPTVIKPVGTTTTTTTTITIQSLPITAYTEHSTTSTTATAIVTGPVAATTPTTLAGPTTSPADHRTAEITTKPPPEDEDYSFESMFSFLFSGDTSSEPPRSPPSVAVTVRPTTTTTTTTSSPRPADAEIRLEHRTDDDAEDGDKVDSFDAAMPTTTTTTTTPRPELDTHHRRPDEPDPETERRADPKPPPEMAIRSGGQHDDDENGIVSRRPTDLDFPPSVGLKISGCNIYGRMYRVGKIIAELSNPCLECMCTEIGVHCNQLPC